MATIARCSPAANKLLIGYDSSSTSPSPPANLTAYCTTPDADVEDRIDRDAEVPQDNEEAQYWPLFGDPDHLGSTSAQKDAKDTEIYYPPGFSDEEVEAEDFSRKFTPKHQKLPKRPAREHATVESDDKLPRKKTKTLLENYGYSDSSSDGDEEDNTQQKKEGRPTKSSKTNIVDARSQTDEPMVGISSNFGLDTPNYDNANITDEEKDMSPEPEDLMAALDEIDHAGSSYNGLGESSAERPIYDLRQKAKNMPTTYLDYDQSGNYDPEEARKKQRLPRKKTTKKSNAPPKAKVKKLIVALRLPNQIGTAVNIMDDVVQKWPDGHSEVDSEDERARMIRRGFYRDNTPDLEPQTPIPDPKNVLNDLTGHPEARGCVGCRLVDDGNKCSMVNGGVWPCARCEEEGQDCQLIIPAVLNGPCMHCRELDLECSHEDSEIDNHDVCDQCVEDACECLPGPPDAYKHPRASIEQIMYSSDRRWTQCTNCRLLGHACSLKTKASKPPCRRCKKLKVGCHFYDIPKAAPKKGGQKKKAERQDNQDNGEGPSNASDEHAWFYEWRASLDAERNLFTTRAHRETTPEETATDAHGHHGVVTKYWTCFSHPITFRFASDTYDASGNLDCSFCEMPMFSMIGNFEKEIHVLKWDDGTGYGELGGGHPDSLGPTTMCTHCTLSRMQTILCASHALQPLPSFDAEAEIGLDDEELRIQRNTIYEEMVDDLISAEPRSQDMRVQIARWCSFCVMPAMYGCVTAQPSLLLGDEEEEEMQGCGLRACAECGPRLCGAEFGGDSRRFAEVKDREEKARSVLGALERDVARADVGFLGWGGLLMRNAPGGEGEEVEVEEEEEEEEDVEMEDVEDTLERVMRRG